MIANYDSFIDWLILINPQAILETYPKDALKQDRFGRTPMQYAIESQKLDAGKSFFIIATDL